MISAVRMVDKIHFPEYTYVGMSGFKYHPWFENGKWHLVLGASGFDEVAILCGIPEDEAVYLKLKYGA